MELGGVGAETGDAEGGAAVDRGSGGLERLLWRLLLTVVEGGRNRIVNSAARKMVKHAEVVRKL